MYSVPCNSAKDKINMQKKFTGMGENYRSKKKCSCVPLASNGNVQPKHKVIMGTLGVALNSENEVMHFETWNNRLCRVQFKNRHSQKRHNSQQRRRFYHRHSAQRTMTNNYGSAFFFSLILFFAPGLTLVSAFFSLFYFGRKTGAHFGDFVSVDFSWISGSFTLDLCREADLFVR